MIDLDLLVDVPVDVEEREQKAAGEGELLAAALAATLVEYRRYVEGRRDGRQGAGSGANWQTIARLEQLRGRA